MPPWSLYRAPPALSRVSSCQVRTALLIQKTVCFNGTRIRSSPISLNWCIIPRNSSEFKMAAGNVARPGQSGLLYVPGWIYDGLLGFILRGIRRRVTSVLLTNDLFPCLDICCGTGGQIRTLKGQGKLILGIDRSFKMIRYAAARSPSSPVVCGDALSLPFGNGLFRSVILSFAIHDKASAARTVILRETRRILAPGGRMILVDFERPWDGASRRGYLLAALIERLAGNPHYRNGREFLATGGLRSFLARNGLIESERTDIAAGSCSITVASPNEPDRPKADSPTSSLSKGRPLRRSVR